MLFCRNGGFGRNFLKEIFLSSFSAPFSVIIGIIEAHNGDFGKAPCSDTDSFVIVDIFARIIVAKEKKQAVAADEPDAFPRTNYS